MNHKKILLQGSRFHQNIRNIRFASDKTDVIECNTPGIGYRSATTYSPVSRKGYLCGIYRYPDDGGQQFFATSYPLLSRLTLSFLSFILVKNEIFAHFAQNYQEE